MPFQSSNVSSNSLLGSTELILPSGFYKTFSCRAKTIPLPNEDTSRPGNLVPANPSDTMAVEILSA